MFKTLIVEDNDTFRQSLKEILKARFPTMVIKEACNGNEALDEVAGLMPDLIFMDIKLPGINGLELTRTIKSAYTDTIIIILTSHDLPEYREAAYASGARFFATKGSSSAEDITALVKLCIPGVNGTCNGITNDLGKPLSPQ
jgi:DNA-binding NarL/FixJ family response regulator